VRGEIGTHEEVKIIERELKEREDKERQNEKIQEIDSERKI
jgi:hypothetical protein